MIGLLLNDVALLFSSIPFLRYTTSALLGRYPGDRLSTLLPFLSDSCGPHDVVIIREVFVADGAYPALRDNFSVQQFPHLGGRS